MLIYNGRLFLRLVKDKKKLYGALTEIPIPENPEGKTLL